jgi:hypothetical protein
VICSCGVDSVFVRNNLPELGTDLVTTLSSLDVNDFSHLICLLVHGLLLDRFLGWFPEVLLFNPALVYWLLPNKLGVMLSLLHLEGRTYRTAVHLQM